MKLNLNVSSCKPKITGKGKCPKSTPPDNATLRQLVDFYKEHCEANSKSKPKSFNTWSLKDAISQAAYGKEACGKHIGHLYCLPTKALKKGGQRLSDKHQTLAGCKSFDELYNEIKNLVKGVSGLGPMYAYDVALRLGGSLKVRPKKVYLQRGTLAGARNLLGRAARGKSVLEMNELASYPELKDLEPAETEDFLCIFKDDLNPEMNSNK